jgi:transglutaminase-like putative cysteine protease
MRFSARLGALGHLADAAYSPATYLPATPTLATLQGLGDGPEGTAQTLRIMRDFARASLRNPAQTVRGMALSITQGVDARNYLGELRACQGWVRDNIRYVQDPEDIELVQTPEKTLEFGAGDCDDKSTLLAALLLSIGHPARFVAVGFDGDPFSHVLVESKIADSWVPCETIVPVALGWYPAGVTSRYVLKV